MRKLPCYIGFHHRSSEKRYRDKDGLYKSVCRRCGVRMVRERLTRQWLVMDDRDARRRTRWARRMLVRMTGPVIFLLILALAFAVAMYLRGPDSFWT